MVDFATNALLFKHHEIKVLFASVDSVEVTNKLVEGLHMQKVQKFVQVLAGVDGPAVAESTGAHLQTGDKTFLHATGFLLDPAGEIVNSLYSSGPIGRFTASDILRKVIFERAKG